MVGIDRTCRLYSLSERRTYWFMRSEKPINEDTFFKFSHARDICCLYLGSTVRGKKCSLDNQKIGEQISWCLLTVSRKTFEVSVVSTASGPTKRSHRCVVCSSMFLFNFERKKWSKIISNTPSTTRNRRWSPTNEQKIHSSACLSFPIPTPLIQNDQKHCTSI